MRLAMTGHLGRGDLGMSCGCLLQNMNMFSYHMQRYPRNVKSMGATWGDKWWCVCVFSVGTVTTIMSVIPLELTTGMSVFCHRLHVHHLYLASFPFWWGQIQPLVVMALHPHVTEGNKHWNPLTRWNLPSKEDLKNQIKFKITSGESYKIQHFMGVSSGINVLSSCPL
jgi:hypothetical protein